MEREPVRRSPLDLMWPTRELYTAGLAAYALGIAGGLAAHTAKRSRSGIASLLLFLSLAGALLELAASLGALLAHCRAELVLRFRGPVLELRGPSGSAFGILQPGSVPAGGRRVGILFRLRRRLPGSQSLRLVLRLFQSASACADPRLHRVERSVLPDRLGTHGGGRLFPGRLRS